MPALPACSHRPGSCPLVVAAQLAVGHHPSYSSGEHGNNSEVIQYLEPLFQRYAVQASRGRRCGANSRVACDAASQQLAARVCLGGEGRGGSGAEGSGRGAVATRCGRGAPATRRGLREAPRRLCLPLGGSSVPAARSRACGHPLWGNKVFSHLWGRKGGALAPVQAYFSGHDHNLEHIHLTGYSAIITGKAAALTHLRPRPACVLGLHAGHWQAGCAERAVDALCARPPAVHGLAPRQPGACLPSCAAHQHAGQVAARHACRGRQQDAAQHGQPGGGVGLLLALLGCAA